MHEAVEQDDQLWEREAAVQTLLGALRESECLFDNFFMSSPAALAILDVRLCFRRVNSTWAEMSGIPAEAHVGRPLRDVLPAVADQVAPVMRGVLLTGQRMRNLEICGPAAGGEDAISHWVANCFPIRDLAGEISGVGCVFLDITDCRRAEQSLRRLSGRLMELQDQERRRIARELHDSVGQCLTAIKINLETLDQSLSKQSLDPRAAKALAEAVSLSDQCSSDTRTISYLLHPPLLDERGLASAIRWYGDGFAQRSGIRLSMELSTDGMRLPQPVETTLFRIVQESLTNIHRHSGSAMAEIRLLADAESVVLEVRDEGHGIPGSSLRRCNGAGRAVGVGIAGMRERVRQFGGRLDISSSSQGTLVRATLPLGGEA
jgi:PAS domain S-box-containing protein